MKSNKSMSRARYADVKDDEYYTLPADIKRELFYYDKHFKDAVVYANCDDDRSAFTQYFRARTDLKGFFHTSDDYFKPENIALLKQADIVCTNPPFSLFREYIETLIRHNKKFLIIGNLNACKYKVILPYIIHNEIWLGYTPSGHHFRRPNGTLKRLGFSVWFTILDHAGRDRELPLTATYDPELYPVYDNLNAIHVGRLKDIPCDYYGRMGVPVTFFERYNRRQFRIIGFDTLIQRPEGSGSAKINGINQFCRVVIERRNEKEPISQGVAMAQGRIL